MLLHLCNAYVVRCRGGVLAAPNCYSRCQRVRQSTSHPSKQAQTKLSTFVHLSSTLHASAILNIRLRMCAHAHVAQKQRSRVRMSHANADTATSSTHARQACEAIRQTCSATASSAMPATVDSASIVSSAAMTTHCPSISSSTATSSSAGAVARPQACARRHAL